MLSEQGSALKQKICHGIGGVYHCCVKMAIVVLLVVAIVAGIQAIGFFSSARTAIQLAQSDYFYCTNNFNWGTEDNTDPKCVIWVKIDD